MQVEEIEKVIFMYSTEHLSKKDKVRFYYALKGRDGKSGIVVSYKIRQLGRTVLMAPNNYETSVDEFLKFWKCPIDKLKVAIRK